MGQMFDALNRALGGNAVETTTENSVVDQKEEKRVSGKIIKVAESGYGFISSKEIPFTRIFFHWTSLRPDTLNFKELKNGMKVSFVGVELEGKGYRAIKIKVEEPPVPVSTPVTTTPEVVSPVEEKQG